MSHKILAAQVQSTLSKRSWQIAKETAFRDFYREKGRVKEATTSKHILKELHKLQTQDKRILKVLNEMAYIDKLLEGDSYVLGLM